MESARNRKKMFDPSPCATCGSEAKTFVEFRQKKKREGIIAVCHVTCSNPDCPFPRDVHVYVKNYSPFRSVNRSMKECCRRWELTYKGAKPWR